MPVFAAVLIIALLLAGVVFVIETVFPAHQKRVRIRLLNRLSNLAIQRHFLVSSQEFFHETLIAFNGVDRKLMIIRCLPSGRFDEHLIDLREVSRLTVQKEYRNEDHRSGLKHVVLMIDFHSGAPSLPIHLFDAAHVKKESIIDMASKACTWETMLNKMVEPAFSRPAFY